MIPAKQEERESRKAVLSAIDEFFKEKFRDGDIISFHWIKDKLGIREPKTIAEVSVIQFELLSKLEMFRDTLLVEHKVAIRNVRGEGYMIVPPGDQARMAIEEGIKMFSKGMKKADKLLDHARVDEMSDYERTRHTDAQIKIKGIKALLSRERRDAFSLFHGRRREIDNNATA